MNRLKIERQENVLAALVEGNSIRSVERMTGVHRDTITRLTNRVGAGCRKVLDERMRGLGSELIQVDELWCYVGKKQRHVSADDDRSQVGDMWTWVALDAESKLVPAFRVGKRELIDAMAFIRDLASRLRNRVQISSDKLNAYRYAIHEAFDGKVDYGTVVKTYEAEPIGPGRYSPPKVVEVRKEAHIGTPDMGRVSTSYVERQNLTIRMGCRRFTRLTNAFSKKRGNLEAAVALHFAHYNLVRPHRSLKRATPAMAAGLESRPWRLAELIEAA